MLLFANCKKEVTQVVQPNRTILKTLDPNNWKFDSASGVYYNEIVVPEIDDEVVLTNGILAYWSFNNTVYESLPDVLDGITIVCLYEKGLFTLEIQNADGSVASPPTGPISLKIVLVKSEI
jgi:hypothetical protein